MDNGLIIITVIYSLLALLMAAIGAVQARSKKPVGFYSHVAPPKAEELSDVSEWNRRHGMMWIAYGVVIALCLIMVLIVGIESVLGIIIVTLTPILPLPFMIKKHNELEKEYLLNKKNGDK